MSREKLQQSFKWIFIERGEMSSFCTADEMMTKDPTILSDEMLIENALNLFIEAGITSAPVSKKSGKVLGLLSDIILVKMVLASRSRGLGDEMLKDYEESLLPITWVKENAQIQEVFKAMVQSQSNRVMVESEFGEIVGILSPKDLLRYLVGDRTESRALTSKVKEYMEKLSKLEDQNEGLRDLVQKYETLFMETPSMMHSIDEKGNIIMANNRLHQILGYSNGDLIGESFLKLYDPVHHQNAQEGLKRVIQDGFHRPIYTTMKTSKGETIKVELVSSALKDKTGKFIGTITVSRKHDNEELLEILNKASDQSN